MHTLQVASSRCGIPQQQIILDKCRIKISRVVAGSKIKEHGNRILGVFADVWGLNLTTPKPR
jgi:hypothetical protein